MLRRCATPPPPFRIQLHKCCATSDPAHSHEKHLVARAVEGLLVGILQGEGGRGAVLPRLGAEVVVEAGAGSHGLGVEVGREGAILRYAFAVSSRFHLHTSEKSAPAQTVHRHIEPSRMQSVHSLLLMPHGKADRQRVTHPPKVGGATHVLHRQSIFLAV